MSINCIMLHIAFGKLLVYRLFFFLPGFQVAFTADTPAALPESGALTFTNVFTNIGSQYDVTSGKFTSKHAGLYYFSFSLIKKRVGNRSEADQVYCYLKLNGQDKVFAGTDPMDDDTDRGRYEASNSMVLHLDSSDVVNLGGCYATVSAFDKRSSFSGFLIELD